VTRTSLDPGLRQAFPRSLLDIGDSRERGDLDSNRTMLPLTLAVRGKRRVGPRIKQVEVELLDKPVEEAKR
jgi:hypothetical protein